MKGVRPFQLRLVGLTKDFKPPNRTGFTWLINLTLLFFSVRVAGTVLGRHLLPNL